jgi:hypothetical protein
MYIPHASSGPFANGVPSNGPYPIILSGEASWCTLTSYNDGCAPTSQAGLEALVNRGYIVAEFGRDNFSYDPDGDGPASYIFSHGAYTLFPYDSFGVNGYDWTAALAWGWGYSRVIDYFETLSYVDKNHICVTGISRGGTASLYAGANDPRIALTVQVQGGSLNARWTNPTYDPESFSALLWRGAPGGPGTTGYFSENLWPFIHNINKLPFDSPSIAALIAPRALLVQADIPSAVFPWEMTQAYLAEKKIWQALGVPGKVGLYTTNQGHYMADAVWNAALDFADQVFFNYYVRTPAATAASVPEQPTDYNTPYWSNMPVTNTWNVPDLTH